MTHSFKTHKGSRPVDSPDSNGAAQSASKVMDLSAKARSFFARILDIKMVRTPQPPNNQFFQLAKKMVMFNNHFHPFPIPNDLGFLGGPTKKCEENQTKKPTNSPPHHGWILRGAPGWIFG